jgi:hypothetical protein
MAKSKATICKMTPLARKLAQLTRTAKSLERARSWEKVAKVRGGSLGRAGISQHPEGWPELPNGEGVVDFRILTASEVEQGREAPPGCESDAPGDGDPS